MNTSITLPEAYENRLALTAKETARALGISDVTLWRLRKRGLIHPSRALRTPLFTLSEIERFLKESSDVLS
ncbi:MAG: Helix-turn-helix domain [Verrucomicrobiota bacterium]|jgi:predicted DNA-binding transcriptional regulator AlpA